jgi:hypothetical protein
MSVSLVGGSTGSHRTGCSLGGGFMPRARCRQSGPEKRWCPPPNTGRYSTKYANCNCDKLNVATGK